MFGKHLLKSDILSKNAGHRPASLLKMSLFHWCFSNILLKPTTWFLRNSNIGGKWVNMYITDAHICKLVSGL